MKDSYLDYMLDEMASWEKRYAHTSGRRMSAARERLYERIGRNYVCAWSGNKKVVWGHKDE